MTLKFWRAESSKSDREIWYTRSRLELIGAPILRVVTWYAGFAGAPIPTTDDLVEKRSVPRVVWWRTAAKEGVETAERFANSSVRLPPTP